MKQVYHPYQVWEGYKSGMYEPCKYGRDERVKLAEYLLSHPEKLKANMERVTREWPNETEHVLSDMTISHRAWLGQSACNVYASCREDETREAWGNITDTQRKAANRVADSVDTNWRDNFEKRNQLQLVLEG